MHLVETKTFHGVKIFYYATEDGSLFRCECLGQSFEGEIGQDVEDAAQAAILAEEEKWTETPVETAERLDDWKRQQWELV